MENTIDTNNPDALGGAVYFVVGRGTEGGASDSYRLSVAGVTSKSWGDVSAVASNSGYSLGAIQVDLGQAGTLPLGTTENRKLKPGEKTYVDAIIDESSAYANAHGLKFTKDTDQLRSQLLSHGNGELTGPKGHQHYRSSIDFIDNDMRNTINAWASSDEGKKWIHHNIDYSQVESVTEKAKDMVDKYGKNIPKEHRFETICILAKTANQYPAALKGYQAVLEKGGNFDDIMAHNKELAETLAHYDGPKAAKIAAEYAKEYADPNKKDALDRANLKVSGKDYDPSKEKDDPDVKVALKAIGGSDHSRLHTAHHGHESSMLRSGMHNEQVQKLQIQLGELGYLDNTATPDGKFGPATRDAVKAYQHDHHLPEVGQAGPATQKAIQADLQPLRQDNPGPLPAVSAMSSLPAGTFGMDDPRNTLNPNHALYSKLQQHLPDASDQRLLQFTAVCHSQGITDRNLTDVRFDQQNGVVSFAGTQNFAAKTATVDVKEPSPPPAQSIQHIQQTDQYRAQIQTQVQATIAQNNLQGPQGPTPGGAPGR
jgi:hypothetical protein